jgi:acetyl esterase/lipase
MMLALDGRYLEAVGARSLIKAAAGLAGPYDFLPLDVEATIEAFGQAPDLTLTQPVNFVTPSAPPAFLAHGLGDTLVYPKNTIALAKKLRAANARVEERLYPKLTHADLLLALAPPFRSKAPVLAEMTNFLRSAA